MKYILGIVAFVMLCVCAWIINGWCDTLGLTTEMKAVVFGVFGLIVTLEVVETVK